MLLILLFFSTSSVAQILSMQVSDTKAPADSLSQAQEKEFMREASKLHPGGWNFDLMGVDLKSKGSKSHSSSSKSPYLTFFGGWGFGLTEGLGMPSGSNVNMGRSFNFCILDAVALRFKPWRTGTFSVGAGLDLRNYRITNGQRFLKGLDSHVTIEDFPEGSIPESSKLHILSSTFSLKYSQNLGKGFRLSVGPEIALSRARNSKRTITNIYDTPLGHQKERFRDIRTNKVGFDVVGAITYKNWLGFYAKYSPSDVLADGYGPKFQTLTTGVLLMGW